MSIPTKTTFDLDTKNGIMGVVLAKIQGGSGAARTASHIALLDSDGTELLISDLDDDGVVLAETAKINLFQAAEQVNASASGTVSYAEIRDSDGVARVSMPAKQGVVDDDDYLVINSLQFLAGAPVELRSIIIG